MSKSDDSQDPENQRRPLLNMAESLDLDVVKEYVDMTSGGSTNRPLFQQMLRDAQSDHFDMVLVWYLDRFSREGIQRTLAYLEKLKRAHVGLKSLQESWLDTSDEGMGQLLISIFSWVAQQNGKKLGRPKGNKDKKPCRKSGYLLRWSTPQETDFFE